MTCWWLWWSELLVCVCVCVCGRGGGWLARCVCFLLFSLLSQTAMPSAFFASVRIHFLDSNGKLDRNLRPFKVISSHLLPLPPSFLSPVRTTCPNSHLPKLSAFPLNLFDRSSHTHSHTELRVKFSIHCTRHIRRWWRRLRRRQSDDFKIKLNFNYTHHANTSFDTFSTFGVHLNSIQNS